MNSATQFAFVSLLLVLLLAVLSWRPAATGIDVQHPKKVSGGYCKGSLALKLEALKSDKISVATGACGAYYDTAEKDASQLEDIFFQFSGRKRHEIDAVIVTAAADVPHGQVTRLLALVKQHCAKCRISVIQD